MYVKANPHFLFFQTLEQVMMATREPLEWHFKQLDHAVGLSFKCVSKLEDIYYCYCPTP